VPYTYRLHYAADVPLSIRALLYVPSTNNEKMGMAVEKSQIHLYSRKVLIKSECSELMPDYLRFIKGVVDCEDLPLNISRETYQDSNLIAKLRHFLTKRALKLLEDEAKRDPEKYSKWYAQFSQFLKEATQTDSENKDTLFRLLRFNANYTDSARKLISLEEYMGKMAKDQKNIYFTYAPNYEAAMASPFYEPFKTLGVDVPIIVLTNQLDEFCFTSSGDYKGFKFVNIEQTQMEEIRKELGIDGG